MFNSLIPNILRTGGQAPSIFQSPQNNPLASALKKFSVQPQAPTPTPAPTATATPSPYQTVVKNPASQTAVTRPTSSTVPVPGMAPIRGAVPGAPTTPTAPTTMTPEQMATAGFKFNIYTGQPINPTPAPEATPTTTDQVNNLIGNVQRPTASDPVADAVTVEQARSDTQAALMKAYEPQLLALDSAMNGELSANDEDAKFREQAFLQNLAVRGILNTSTEDPVLRKRYADGESKISSAIRDKYTLQKMALLGKIGDDAYKAGVKKADDLIAAKKAELENYYNELDSQRETYKLLSDEQIAKEQQKISREQLEVDRKYKEGSLTIDQYNSETNRIKTESDKLVNEAQVRKLNAETTKVGAETSALNAANTPIGGGKGGDQISFLKTTAQNALDLAGASGASGISQFLGDKFVGDTKFRQLEQYTDTLKTNLMTLMTDPTIKKFFGPQMTNRDVELMTSAGTTLNPSKNSPQQMRDEIGRINNLLGRMEAAVSGGAPKASGSSDMVTIKKPDGTTGTIPKSNLDAALKLGAKQI